MVKTVMHRQNCFKLTELSIASSQMTRVIWLQGSDSALIAIHLPTVFYKYRDRYNKSIYTSGKEKLVFQFYKIAITHFTMGDLKGCGISQKNN